MTRRASPILLAGLLAVVSVQVAAKDSLGVFSGWAAFRDASVPRCYAIAKPEVPTRQRDLDRREYVPYATVGSWPKRQLRNQLHFRLSREMAKNARATLTLGGRSFALTGGGGDAWAKDKAMDAAIIAAMRSASRMSISAVDKRGNRFADRYDLKGAATAIDAATLGCSRR
ncbi:invasion associated locus B family protein [Altererythrobacter arenosus]|uniref:Invasion associated locus B family protein n=1 Tax=Altererythrobacter arenosus TaxID=3032592 RepID=A0ABY8FPE2_9SPHN|nr:invasion associated locus B family protein [Altererythrobacter sp. CAU 1644]WFL76727.1 invasion associated locus B family protein [Altererythrobacter sp. CAU 1644]